MDALYIGVYKSHRAIVHCGKCHLPLMVVRERSMYFIWCVCSDAQDEAWGKNSENIFGRLLRTCMHAGALLLVASVMCICMSDSRG